MQTRNNRIWRYILPVVIALIGVVALLLPTFLQDRPDISETYAREIFPHISAPYLWINGLFPFSLTEVLVLSILPIAILSVILWIRAIRRTSDRAIYVQRTLVAAALMFSIIAMTYSLFHGILYTRYTLASNIDLSSEQRSPEELEEVTRWLLEKTVEARANATENQEGVMTLPAPIDPTMQDADRAMQLASARFPVLSGNSARAKPVMLSSYWSYTGITGMYFPFFMEANVNIDAPDIDLPFTVCHELAHLRGIAREQDANLAAFLACLSSDQPNFQYSGYQYALLYCLADLNFANPDLHSELLTQISDGIWRDWENKSAYWDNLEGPVQEVSSNVNDSFLKANNQAEGVRSYSLVTDLIIDYYFEFVKE